MQCYADYKEGPIPGMHGSDGQSVSNTLVLRAVREIEGGPGGHGPRNILAMPRLESSGKVVTRAYTLP